MENLPNQLIIFLFTILLLVFAELRFIAPFSFIYLHFYLLQFLWVKTENWQRYLYVLLSAFILDIFSGQIIGVTLVVFAICGLILNLIHNYVPILDSRMGIAKRSIWTILGIIVIGIITNWSVINIIITLVVSIIIQNLLIYYFERIISSTQTNGKIGIE